MSKKGLTSSLGTGQEMGWYEMYTVKPRAVNLDRLVQQLTQHGYTFVMKLDYGETQGRRLKNKAGRMLDISVRKMENNEVYVILRLIQF
ncbi:hypothetical protein [Deinococcus hopiensis]|nr:hypothetical protein [Deinococcus hopiensis]